MKFYSTLSIFKYSWDQVAVGFWSRYPNPYSMHVLTEDVIDQRVLSCGSLLTKRLITKTNSIPKWGEKFIPGPKHVCVLEESIVDPQTKTMKTYTRNLGYTSIMTVEEECTYKPSEENEGWTVCQRHATVNSKVKGFSYCLQTFGIERFKKNVTKSVKGFNFVLNKLYPGMPEAYLTKKQKLKQTAEAAKKIASSVIATN
ncbi:hypothetical protein HELRODRAFT_187087 [Helobdella robusta]|uniref:PRELI/MSF1 domain-containing protein n=1 Tax=Helobdella robusta TaxID=6412 RepID=T1FP67_HELRO|nr:hypothetical protein HELRODRAFT_187087 [Helobdella robusta]ESO03380.1 hypothetical protein HELRODRAFT_187087 [Helobdella robusta]